MPRVLILWQSLLGGVSINELTAAGKTSPKFVAIRWFALLLMTAIALDVTPRAWSMIRAPQRLLSHVLNRVGLWQGEWSMFSPDPETDNGWLSAEVEDAAGQSSTWFSPNWSEAGGWEKFVRFRHVNYYNRLPKNANVPAWDDFADYLARSRPAPVRKLSLFRNSMQFLRPEDGSLPTRQEETWTTSSEFLTERIYQP